MLVAHFQQSAIINHSRIDMGALQSGQAHMRTSPSIHIAPACLVPVVAASLGAAADSGIVVPGPLGIPSAPESSGRSGNGSSEVKSKTGRLPSSADGSSVSP
jgi:hypothetical protein